MDDFVNPNNIPIPRGVPDHQGKTMLMDFKFSFDVSGTHSINYTWIKKMGIVIDNKGRLYLYTNMTALAIMARGKNDFILTTPGIGGWFITMSLKGGGRLYQIPGYTNRYFRFDYNENRDLFITGIRKLEDSGEVTFEKITSRKLFLNRLEVKYLDGAQKKKISERKSFYKRIGNADG